MKEQQAIATLYEQFTESTGFLQQLARGAGLDREGVQAAKQAFQTLRHAWENCDEVPRDATLALTYLDEALPQYFDRYPSLKEELIELYFDLMLKVADIFEERIIPELTPSDDAEIPFDFWSIWSEHAVILDRPLTEEESLAVLRKHLYGDGLVCALRTRAGSFNVLGVAKAWRLLHMALDTMEPIWATHPYLPKDIAWSLVEVRERITNGWSFYDGMPTLQERLRLLADDLGSRVQSCLQGNKQH